MLKDELKVLHNLTSTLCQGTNEPNELVLTFLNDPTTYIQSECHRVKRAWTDLLFSHTRDLALGRYVGFQQQILLEIADNLYNLIQGKKSPTLSCLTASDPAILVLLLENVLELNQFLTQYFKAFINLDIKIPAATILEVRKKMSECAEKLSVSIQQIEIDHLLKACILDYLQVATAINDKYPITYRSQEYLIQFADFISNAIDFEDGRDLTYRVIEALFYLNFNYNNFCLWYFEDVTKKTIALTPKEQISMLKKQLLFLRSIPVMLNTCYNLEILPVNQLLESWLLEYMKERGLQQQSGVLFQDKVKLRLTVAQLALMIRLLYEEDVFATKNITSLLRFFSSHFTSKKQEHISYGSMSKLYYSGDQFTGFAVRALLLRMIAKINKMFFPT